MRLKNFGSALILTFVTTAAANSQTPQPPSIQINEANRTLSVSASDHAEADAEVADLHVGYTVYGATLPATYKAASDTSNTIVQAMAAAGAKRTDIQSGSQSVARLSDYEIKQQKGAKFRVSQSWTVSLAPKDAALILDAAIQAGANQSGDITWRMKNSTALDAEAIRRATERARLLAEELAKGLGATLGKALYATNSVSGGVLMSRGVMMNAYAAKTTEANQLTPLAVEPQRVQSEATVQIVYALQ